MWYNAIVTLNDPSKKVVVMYLHERKLDWLRKETFVYRHHLRYPLVPQ